jgi:hypothetical protein
MRRKEFEPETTMMELHLLRSSFTKRNNHVCNYHLQYLKSSVADPDPRSGIRCLFIPWIRDEHPGSVIRIREEHPGSYFRELRNNFLVKNT